MYAGRCSRESGGDEPLVTRSRDVIRLLKAIAPFVYVHRRSAASVYGSLYITYIQCPKLRFYLVRPQGAFFLKLCAREYLHAPSIYVVIITGSKNVHTPGAHL